MVCYLGGAFYPKWVCGAGPVRLRTWGSSKPGRVLKNDFKGSTVPAGSYIVMPKGMHHFAVAKGDVVQAHGVGPFKIHWVK